MDREAWYSVTPEGIARHLARFIAEKKSTESVIIDAFCGVHLSSAVVDVGRKQFHSIRKIFRQR